MMVNIDPDMIRMDREAYVAHRVAQARSWREWLGGKFIAKDADEAAYRAGLAWDAWREFVRPVHEPIGDTNDTTP